MANKTRTATKKGKKKNKVNTYLENHEFREAFKIFLDEKKKESNKKTSWSHKNTCLLHQIYPVAQPFIPSEQIPAHKWSICQCDKYKNEIKNKTPIYRIGLNQILTHQYKKKNAYFTDLLLQFDEKYYEINLMNMCAGEIKKTTQPATRKNRLGTACFYDDQFIIKFDEDTYVVWRLKSRYTKQQVTVEEEADCRRKDVADWWYQCWSVHGLREGESHKVNQFISFHNNPFVGNLSKCYERIVLYIYCNPTSTVTVNNKQYTKCADLEIPKQRYHDTKKHINCDNKPVAHDVLNLSQNATQSQESTTQSSQGSICALDGVDQAISTDPVQKCVSRKCRQEIAKRDEKIKKLKKKVEILTNQNRILSDNLVIATKDTTNGFDLRDNIHIFSDLSQPTSQSQEPPTEPEHKRRKLNDGSKMSTEYVYL